MPVQEMREYADLLEMAFSKEKIEQRVTALEEIINIHLIKLFGVVADDGLRNHWKKELKAFYRKISRMVWKNTNKTLNANFYYNILYEEPFGGTEERNIKSILEIDIIQETGYMKNNETIQNINEKMKNFHKNIAIALETNQNFDHIFINL